MTEIKRIVFISSEFPPLPGGIGNHAFHLSHHLRKNGYQVAVSTNQRSSDLKGDLVFDKAQTYAIYRVKRYSLVVFTYMQRIEQGFQLVVRHKPELIIASGKFSLWLCGLLKVCFPNKKNLAVLHGSELFAGSKISRELTKWSLRRFDKIIAVSNFTRDLALTIESLLPVEVVNNGFSVPIISKTETFQLEGFPKLVTVGNVTYRKGQQNVIEALPKIRTKFPEVHYHIIGLPTEKRSFELQAKELGVADLVTFHDEMTNQQLFSAVSLCDVFMMLSQRLENGDVEGFGIAVLEANSLGLPAIGSSDSGIADAIRGNFSGKLVLPHDIDSIADALEEILSDYDHYSSNAKKWAVNFGWEDIIQKYIKVIEK